MQAENSTLPLQAPRTPADSAKKHAARVLVVDDEWLVRWSVRETLSARGFDVIEAADAKSAIEAYANGCDLVLLDLHLPDAQDVRVLTCIRATAPTLPVVMTSTFLTPEIAEQAKALGAAVMSKPFDLADLTAAVEAALAGRVY